MSEALLPSCMDEDNALLCRTVVAPAIAHYRLTGAPGRSSREYIFRGAGWPLRLEGVTQSYNFDQTIEMLRGTVWSHLLEGVTKSYYFDPTIEVLGSLPIASASAIFVWPSGDLATRQLLETMWAGATCGTSAEPAINIAVADTPPLSSAQLRVDRLVKIQGSFGLPMLALARVFQISRAQLYKWLDASKSITLHEESATRLALIGQLADSWRARSARPLGELAQERLDGGKTIVQLLSAPDLNTAAVERAFTELRNKLRSLPETLDQRMREAGFVRRPSHRALPSDE